MCDLKDEMVSSLKEKYRPNISVEKGFNHSYFLH